ncbi:MAG: Mth938-like domain-containing protein [Sphingobacteriia bacterium]|nr:Mth938-like domain-containing protein [Sphingobacteriia bacterium]
MDITPLAFKNKKIINSYNENSFTINTEVYGSKILLINDQVISLENSSSNLSENDFNVFFNNHVDTEIILIGVGNSITSISFDIKSKLKELNISIDVMPSSAAIRTYNILTLEDRKVAALISLL